MKNETPSVGCGCARPNPSHETRDAEASAPCACGDACRCGEACKCEGCSHRKQ